VAGRIGEVTKAGHAIQDILALQPKSFNEPSDLKLNVRLLFVEIIVAGTVPPE
jgi:hypothetical protein